jgi:hypothetical protein
MNYIACMELLPSKIRLLGAGPFAGGYPSQDGSTGRPLVGAKKANAERLAVTLKNIGKPHWQAVGHLSKPPRVFDLWKPGFRPLATMRQQRITQWLT